MAIMPIALDKNLENLLNSLRGEEIVFHPNPGNAGDALIFCATLQIFKRFGLNFKLDKNIENPTGKVFIYGGGGNLVRYYCNGENTIIKNIEKAKRVVVLPHTVEGKDLFLQKFGDSMDIFLRESRSYNYVKSICPKGNVFLSHDMAFCFDIDQFFKDYKKIKKCQSFYFKRKQFGKYISALKNSCFAGFGSIISKNLSLYAFRNDVEGAMKINSRCNVDLSKIFFPISMKEERCFESVSGIINFIKIHDIVYTDRLHLMVISALMGKKVYFYPGNYYKNNEVYEHSVKGNFKNVIFVG